MRIKLVEGKQTELIEFAKKLFTWSELSVKIKLSESYLRNQIKREEVLLSEISFNKLCEICNINFDKFIVEKLEDHWGRSLGGKNSTGSLKKKIKFPEESSELSELYGIMLGDGSLTKKTGYKIGTYEIRITGDSRFDKDYLMNYVKPLIKKLFEVSVSSFESKKSNELFIRAHGKLLVEFFESKGFKPGHKIRNKLNIPDWIKDNNDFLKVCLRGLFDTDGSVYKLPKQNVYQITFTNHNPFLLNDLREGLIRLGIAPSQISNGRKLYITKKSELRKFLKEVDFRNSKHLNKIKMWNI